MLELLNKTRICVHVLGGKCYHMCLRLSHHLVCADMNPLGRVSFWLGKRFPSPSPPHVSPLRQYLADVGTGALMDSVPTLECRPGEGSRAVAASNPWLWPPTFSSLCIKPLAARCQVLSA